MLQSARFVLAALVLLLSPLVLPPFEAGAAEDVMEWQFSAGSEPENKGRTTARLIYGVIETDNVRAAGVCEDTKTPAARTAAFRLAADVGKLESGKSVEVRFSGGGFDHTVKGVVRRAVSEADFDGVSLELRHDDPLWGAMSEQSSLDYLVPGYRASTLDFVRGRNSIARFVETCRSYAEAFEKSGSAVAATAIGEAGDAAEKEAFESAKELGTVEGWDAFIANFKTGFRADLARAYRKRLADQSTAPAAAPGAPMPVVDASVTGLNVTRVLYSGGEFVQNGATTWLEKREGETTLRYVQTRRTSQSLMLFDASRRAGITLDIAGRSILFAKGSETPEKIYDIEQAFADPVSASAEPEEASEPADRPAAKPKPKPVKAKEIACEEGYKVVNGRCKRIKSTQKPQGCPPGTEPVPETDDCRWKTDKNGFEVEPWKKPGCKTWQAQCSKGNSAACASYEATCQVN